MRMFGGIRVIEDKTLVKTMEDWSRVRSPSRAVRRRRQGKRQNIQLVEVPLESVFRMGDTMVMHPLIAAKLRREIAQIA